MEVWIGCARRTEADDAVDMKVLNRFGEASGGTAWEISEAAFGRNMDAVLDAIAAELPSNPAHRHAAR